MKLLALDQASRTSGYAVFEDGELIKYGTFSTSSDDTGEKLVEIRQKVIELITEYNITDVAFEDIMLSNLQNNVATHKVLAEVLGVVQELIAEKPVDYEIIPALSWKYGIGLKSKKRADQKKEAQQYVLDNYNIKATQDEADAICIGTYYLQKHKSAF